MEQSYLIKPVLDANYPMIDYGKGVYLYDQAGKKYLDASSGAVTSNIGHGVPEIIEAMKAQAQKVSFVYRSQFTSEPAEALAQKIAQLVGGNLNWSFFVNSGSEATETAMKIAIQYWQEQGKATKTKILSRWVSYHGITMGALSMSGHPLRRNRFIPHLDDCPTINPPYCYRCPYQLRSPECGHQCAHELENAIKRIGKEHIAAFIAEPIIGAAGGAITPPNGYYQVIKDICERNEILFIADEVMTGFGRTGKVLACEHWEVEPDIVALGKGMGAGYATIAATLVSDKVIAPILSGSKLIMSGHTLSANPQACAVSLAVLEYLDTKQIISAVEPKGTYLRNKLMKLMNQFTFIGDIRGKGLMLGMEVVENKFTKQPFSRKVQAIKMLIDLAQTNGLLIYPANAGLDGVNGDAVIIAPPLTITKREIDELIRLLTLTLSQFEQRLSSLNNLKGES
ncbi:aspartate aminotransferase family protein [Bacillus sp. DNRA2]|uniref:aspartate aminotransferase family protein n=1 Tax=Bacillus sp. DNRA2 TaxID=2723053 RepID=UPI00145D1254|nr:aspartate aminotransferase family protein [Bacillus sp. DNRA2]NMD72256.1 aspartate aminotransferase family protein [Bacillus sp. DNRA2]